MNKIQIGTRWVGNDLPVFVIAEAGVNHNGDIKLAEKLIRESKKCGADCVKFQSFKADRVVSLDAPKAQYQLQTTDPRETQYEMLRKLELKENDYSKLISVCRDENVLFLSTPYNSEDVDFLYALDVPAYKIASGQLIELPFLEYVAKKGKPVIISTGMGTLDEVKTAVETIRNTGNNQIVILQCTTHYPSCIEDANLRAMSTMREACRALVGYSDHTSGDLSAIAAVALGACIIEKHFTLDKDLEGPDQSCSANPEEFMRLVKNIRFVEQSLGSSQKYPTKLESVNARMMRRSIFAKQAIPAGAILSLENISFKRPAIGILGTQSGCVFGKRAKHNISENTLITMDLIE
ncbi:MAG: N-acetylneuraminate synthase [Candidatus Omnitrophica bacterium]|nr:N-acetylneuraminate synthase [Candidatus Omnitrophota bacterium]